MFYSYTAAMVPLLPTGKKGGGGELKLDLLYLCFSVNGCHRSPRSFYLQDVMIFIDYKHNVECTIFVL